MANNKNSLSATSLFFVLLQIAFIVLKLCKVIDWPWGWVVSPMWITTAVAIAVAIGLYVIVFSIAWIVGIRQEKNERADDKPARLQPKSRWQERMEEMKNKKL